MDRRTRIRWDRLGRWALIAVLAFVVYLYIGPAATWVSTYREAGRKRAEVAALKAENGGCASAGASSAIRRRSSARRAGSGWSRRARSRIVIEGLPRR